MSTALSRWCLCGATLHVTATPGDAAEDIARLFVERHSGDGHGPATSTEAARARRIEQRTENR